VRERGGIAVVVAHRPSAIGAVDQVLMMEGGRQKAFGPRDAVLGQVLKPSPAARSGKGFAVTGQGVMPLRVVANPAKTESDGEPEEKDAKH
jgi:ABC-type protease/lipase transport system fused ATPase/permease subunit